MSKIERKFKYCETCGIVLVPRVQTCPCCRGIWLGVINGVGKAVKKV